MPHAAVSFLAAVACASGTANLRYVETSAGQTGKFDSLAECEVEFDKLSERCSRGSALNHDAMGDGYRSGAGGHGQYFPPGNFGKPDPEGGWDYREHGDSWSGLGQCGLSNQSPVDLPKYIDVRGQTKHVLWFDYYADPDLTPNLRAKIINDGHAIFYDVASNKVDLGFVKIGSQEYAASDYTFHAPSEHTIDGSSFPLEVQVINEQRGGSGMVGVSILFKEGASNPFLASLKDGMNGNMPAWSLKGAGIATVSGVFTGAFDLDGLIPRGGAGQESTFYNYQGSLTQPPCTVGVDWWVLSTPISGTREELRFVRNAIFASPSMRHGNARSTMPLDGRGIWAGLTSFQHAIKFHNLPEWRTKDAWQEPRGYSSQDMPWGDHWETKISSPAPAPATSPAGSPGPGAAPGAGAPAPAKV